ncbi:MAG TPA: hypothetical protein VMU82_08860 [Acetobacteraceae bacterium]|nr:hypothetical protein [Acetobacteraceae bacterium]
MSITATPNGAGGWIVECGGETVTLAPAPSASPAISTPAPGGVRPGMPGGGTMHLRAPIAPAPPHVGVLHLHVESGLHETGPARPVLSLPPGAENHHATPARLAALREGLGGAWPDGLRVRVHAGAEGADMGAVRTVLASAGLPPGVPLDVVGAGDGR